MERRQFIKSTAIGAAGFAVTGKTTSTVFGESGKKHPIHIFTKCLQFLNFDEIAEVLARYGFDGADLTVRPGGQVLPENVETELPKAIKALQKQGIGSDMITTAINDPEDQYTIPVLKTMADLGIRYYRMGWLSYDNSKSVIQNLDGFKATFEKIENLNRKFNVCGNYQNHSGTGVGSPVWDLHHVLKDRNPEYIGVQYDIRHATVEGAVSWPLGMKLLSKWIKTTDIKDFIWAKNENGKWEIKNTPLGEGMVDFDEYFKLYKSFNINTPVSIHYEYDLGGAEHGRENPTMSNEEIFSWLKKDITFLKVQFDKYNL